VEYDIERMQKRKLVSESLARVSSKLKWGPMDSYLYFGSLLCAGHIGDQNIELVRRRDYKLQRLHPWERMAVPYRLNVRRMRMFTHADEVAAT
jgi:hypothetical protein